MLRFLPLVCVVAALRAEVPAPLADALKKSRAEAEHWAYTETLVETDQKAHPQGETVIHFDPSRPYAEQFQPVLVHGHAPTPKELEHYRDLGEKRGKRLMDKAEKEANGEKEKPRIEIGYGHAEIDFSQAREIGEDATSIRYQVPLHDPSHTFPTEKIELTLRVTKAGHTFDSATLRLVSPFRLKVLLHVLQGQLDIKWSQVDPRHPPTMTEEKGSLAVSLLFVHLHGWQTMQRSNFRHVTPYAERFGVKVGPLKALPF